MYWIESPNPAPFLHGRPFWLINGKNPSTRVPVYMFSTGIDTTPINWDPTTSLSFTRKWISAAWCATGTLKCCFQIGFSLLEITYVLPITALVMAIDTYGSLVILLRVPGNLLKKSPMVLWNMSMFGRFLASCIHMSRFPCRRRTFRAFFDGLSATIWYGWLFWGLMNDGALLKVGLV